jgi:hypothetical protein
VFIEGNYEGQALRYTTHVTTGFDVRNTMWWAVLAGATGAFGGNHWINHFLPDWPSHLADSGADNVRYLRGILTGRRWDLLVPDIHHTVATAGYGTFSNCCTAQDNDYVTTARASDGSLVISYFPVPHDLVIDTSSLAGPATVRVVRSHDRRLDAGSRLGGAEHRLASVHAAGDLARGRLVRLGPRHRDARANPARNVRHRGPPCCSGSRGAGASRITSARCGEARAESGFACALPERVARIAVAAKKSSVGAVRAFHSGNADAIQSSLRRREGQEEAEAFFKRSGARRVPGNRREPAGRT